MDQVAIAVAIAMVAVVELGVGARSRNVVQPITVIDKARLITWVLLPN